MKKLLVAVLAALFSHVALASGDACSKLKAAECKKNSECAWKGKKCSVKAAAKAAKAAPKKAAPATDAAPSTTAPAEAAPADMPADEGEDLEDM